MKTALIRENIEDAAKLIKDGELVAVPTETVYGLAGNGLDAHAVEMIYEVKGRPQVKPLALMVPDSGDMEKYCEDVPAQAKKLAERFWPGPLTLVVRAAPEIPAVVRAGGETVGLRCPDHPLTLELLRQCGLPLAGPSANPSGAPARMSLTCSILPQASLTATILGTSEASRRQVAALILTPVLPGTL